MKNKLKTIAIVGVCVVILLLYSALAMFFFRMGYKTCGYLFSAVAVSGGLMAVWAIAKEEGGDV